MEDLGIVIRKSGFPARGVLKGDISISSLKGNREDVSIEGLIEGSDLYLSLIHLSIPISDGSFQIDFSGKRASIKDCYMQVGQSPTTISGDLTGWDAIKGDITVRSDFFNMSNILLPNDSPKSRDKIEDSDSFLHDMDIAVNLDISRGIWRKLTFGQMRADLNLRHSGVYINNSSIDMKNGALTLKGHMTAGEEPNLMFTGDIRLSEQPLYEIIESLNIGYESLVGSLTMEARLSMEGSGKGDLIPSLTGQASASINQGLVRKSRVFIKVLDFFSLQKIYKQRPPELREEGFYFESMDADVVIDKGIFSSENFVMKSPVFNAVGYGKVDITQQTIDFLLGAQPHGTIDNLVSNIPILGHIITGDKRSILLYPFEVKGAVSSPEVRFVPIESLGEGVGGVLKRILLTPVKILKDINRAATTSQKENSTLPDQQ
jgi:hypothetical protein